MNNIAVINCGSKKQLNACQAKDMYKGGNLYDMMLEYVENNYDEYYIISGKYGLLEPTQIIEPYEDVVFFVQKIFRDRAKKQGKTIEAVSKKDQREWGKKVWESKNWNQYDRVDFYINIYYWEPMKQWFNNGEKFIHHKFSSSLGPNLKKFKQQNEQNKNKNNENDFFVFD
jgi:hypothetical protein